MQRGALIRKGALIGRRALNRIITVWHHLVLFMWWRENDFRDHIHIQLLTPEYKIKIAASKIDRVT